MKPVANRYQETRLWQNHQTTLRSIQESAAKTKNNSNTNQTGKLKDVLKDQVDLTDPASTSLEARTEKLLNQLEKNFPGLSFEIVPDSDLGNLKEKAASLGQGKHLLISESFLKRMSSSEKDFQACKSMMLASTLLLAENKASGVFLSEKQATSWTIKEKESKTEKDPETETLAKMLENLKEARNNSKIKVSSNVSYETGELYRKLARAGDKALVQSVVSETYQNMGALRLIACMGEDKERAKAQKAIRSLEKLVTRSRQKMRQLDKEELLKLKRKRAIKRQEEAKLKEIQQELKKLQTKKARLNKKLLEEGDAADREIQRLKQHLAYASNNQLFSASPAPIKASAGADIAASDGACVSTDQVEFSEPVAF